MCGRYRGPAQSNRWSAAPSALLLSSDTETSTQLATIRPSCEQRWRQKSSLHPNKEQSRLRRAPASTLPLPDDKGPGET
jgi:hypothetical protein